MMYKNVKLLPSEIRKMKQIFPDIDNLIADDEGLEYKEYRISIFSQCLTREESNKLLDNIPKNIERIRTVKLQRFILSLCKEFDAYLIIYNKEKKTFEYKQVISEDDIKLSHSMVPNWNRVKLVIPSIKAIYFENCDFTHLLYFKNDKILSRFKYLVKKKGLNII